MKFYRSKTYKVIFISILYGSVLYGCNQDYGKLFEKGFLSKIRNIKGNDKIIVSFDKRYNFPWSYACFYEASNVLVYFYEYDKKPKIKYFFIPSNQPIKPSRILAMNGGIFMKENYVAKSPATKCFNRQQKYIIYRDYKISNNNKNIVFSLY